jgi:nucleotide-binding universal stress UspA family protein
MNTNERPVIIGYRGGPGGEDGLALGLLWAGLLGSPAVVVTVYPGPAPIGVGRVDAEWVADRRREAERLLDEAQRLKPTTAVVDFLAVGSGSVAHGLHDIAEEREASLLVIGSHQDSQRRLLIASTGDRVIAGAPCPVAVAPQAWARGSSPQLTRIGVAYLPTPDGREALRVAADFAKYTGARLHLVTVLAGEAEVMSYRIGVDAEHVYVSAAREEYQQSIEAAIADLASGVEATGEVLVGDVAETLTGLRNAIDALFMGSRGYGPIRRVLLGGVSSKLMQRLDVPGVVVPRSAEVFPSNE